MQNSQVSVIQNDRLGQGSSLQVLNLASQVNKIRSKRDIRQIQFDKQQIKIYMHIRDAKSYIDNKSTLKQKLPNDFVRRSKFMQTDEERKLEIAKENRRLISNIGNILKNKKLNRDLNFQASQQSGRSSASSQRSLNKGYRKEQQRRIGFENDRMLDRLYLQKGVIDALEFKRHSKKHEKLMTSIRSNDSVPCAFYTAPKSRGSSRQSKRSVTPNRPQWESSTSIRQQTNSTATRMRHPFQKALIATSYQIEKPNIMSPRPTSNNDLVTQPERRKTTSSMAPNHPGNDRKKFFVLSPKGNPINLNTSSGFGLDHYSYVNHDNQQGFNTEYRKIGNASISRLRKTPSVHKRAITPQTFRHAQTSFTPFTITQMYNNKEFTDRIVLLQVKALISGIKHNVEISLGNNKCFIACVRQQKTQLITVFHKQAIKLVSELSDGGPFSDLREVPQKDLRMLLKLLKITGDTIKLDTCVFDGEISFNLL